MDFLPWKTFHRVVARFDGDRRVRTLSSGLFSSLTFDGGFGIPGGENV
jgi:hypothetical protein